jgi:hypothetical protein
VAHLQNLDPSNIIPIPVTKASDSDFFQENFSLRQRIGEMANIIDEQVNVIALQKELIQQFRDEIATLKGEKPKPKIPPNKLESTGKSDWRKRISLHNNKGKVFSFFLWGKSSTNFDTLSQRSFSAKLTIDETLLERSLKISRLCKRIIKTVKRVASKPGQPRGKSRRKKKTVLQIHAKREIHPENIPEEAKFKGFNRYTVQEIIIEPRNIQYQLARWQLPDGSYITGKLPKNIHGHYGPRLIAYILNQYHACRVTEHLLLDQLHAFGILISAGQLNNILIENKDSFIKEVAELLPVAARVEKQVQADDTGGRHNGQNQYTTIIGNRWFSIFTTTDSKSRVNFLKLLQGGKEEYVINEDTLDYLSLVNVSSYFPGYVGQSLNSKFTTSAEWEQFLGEHNLSETEKRFLTEAALYASVIENGIPRDLGVHSDDAGQFMVFVHSLCWIHEDRHYRKLIMTTDESRAELERIRGQIWTLYQGLQKYKECPTSKSKESLEKEFDHIFLQKTSSPTLNRQLEKTYGKKQELLMVLQRPETSLHNNSTETCARAAKIKLKISGGTRSETGRKVRDTFLSLKQTCRKLGINFMAFLEDRVQGLYKIPRLAIIILERATATSKDPPIPLSSMNEVVLQPDVRQFTG